MEQAEKAEMLSKMMDLLSGKEMHTLAEMSPEGLHEFCRQIKLRWEEEQAAIAEPGPTADA